MSPSYATSLPQPIAIRTMRRCRLTLKSAWRIETGDLRTSTTSIPSTQTRQTIATNTREPLDANSLAELKADIVRTFTKCNNGALETDWSNFPALSKKRCFKREWSFHSSVLTNALVAYVLQAPDVSTCLETPEGLAFFEFLPPT